jgi:WD40 repeat protein
LDNTLRLWDLASGESRKLEGHSSSVSGAVLLAGGARALSWSLDNTLRLWDLASGESRKLEGHTNWVSGALLLAGGARALSWSEDRTLRLWDLRSLHELARFTGDDPLTCCVVSDDERLAVVGDSRGRVLRFDLPA